MKSLVTCFLLLLSYIPVVLGQSSQQLSEADLVVSSPVLASGEDGHVFNQHTAIVRTGESVFAPSFIDAYSNSAGNNWTYRQTIGPDVCAGSGSLSIEGDTLVIGEPCEPSPSFGRINIYNRDASGVWVHTQMLEQPAPASARQNFGMSVNLSGDTLAVGANPGGESDEPAKIFLYSRTGNQWELQTVLQTGEHSADAFGREIALSGDTLLASIFLPEGYGFRVYRRGEDGNWTLESSELAEEFAVYGNTIMLSRHRPDVVQNMLLFRTTDNAGQSTDQTVLTGDGFARSLNLNEGRAVSADTYISDSPLNRTVVSHYQRMSNGEWVYSGEIVPQTDDSISAADVNGNLVLVRTVNFQTAVEPAFGTFITDISGGDSTATATGGDSSGCIDTPPVGDGWGWNGEASCRVLSDMAQLAEACIDADGDGWGWDGVQTCVVAPPVSESQCVDYDGDGWGWDGTASCLADAAAGRELDYSEFPCVDEDGDGWGWQQPADQPELGRTCRVGG